MENHTKEIRLRDPLPEDSKALFRIRADRALQNELMAYPPALYADDLDEWLSRRKNAPNGIFKVIAEVRENRCVGFVQIASIHRRSMHGYFGIAVDPEMQGRGYGGAAVSEVLQYARSTGAFHKLLLEVRGDNSRAIRLYKAKGFREVGTLADHYLQDGVWRQVVLMEIILAPPAPPEGIGG